MIFADSEIAGEVFKVGAMAAVVAFLFRALISSKDETLAQMKAAHELALKQLADEKLEVEGIKKIYQEIAADAVKSARATTDFYRMKNGLAPLIPLAPVISESQSPSTAIQRETAAISTLRAEMAAIKLLTGQEPRVEPEHAVEVPRTVPSLTSALAKKTADLAVDTAEVAKETSAEVQKQQEKG